MRTLILCGIGCALVFGAYSCAGFTSNVCDYPGACTGDGGTIEGGKDGTSDVSIDAPPDCDLTKDPKDSPSCIDDGVGVFVSPTGNEANPGTKALPVKTLATALTKLGGKPRIYMCEGNYPGSVEIKTGVAIYGALKCDWTAGGARPVIQADKPAFGLQLEAANISLIDIEVDGADGVADGESSVGVFANAASGAALTRVKVIAGNGKNGKPGNTGSNYTAVAQSDPSIAGKNASGITGGGPHACTLCTDNKNSVGGGGGNGASSPSDGSDGSPNLNGVNPIDGKGGAKDIGIGCGNGHKGPTGDAGVPATSYIALASLTTAWIPTAGTSGNNAGPAQGGGGGGGGIDLGNTIGGGGGGGCGGCGGAGGTGGTGGGASIGLLSVSSGITVTSSEITTKQAGNGGPGAAGQAGQAGGFSGASSAPGCNGGSGGNGGLGGSGSGGAGGLSAPIVFKGTAPTIDIATTGKLTPGTKGTKGAGGTPGTNDGPDGLSQPSFECKAPLCN